MVHGSQHWKAAILFLLGHNPGHAVYNFVLVNKNERHRLVVAPEHESC